MLVTGLTATAAVSAYSARVTGRRSVSGLAGLWAGITAGVILVASIIAVDLLLASRLATSVWAQDPTCPQPAGDALKSCAIGDDLGLTAVVLTMLPVLLAGAGALAGLWTAARTTAPAPTDQPRNADGWRPPLTFMAIAVTLFIAEIGFKLI